ncbi:TetR family transcriptional regulator [Prescottella equi]|uniref:TetR family transcriptional regulator n=1 Tax=Rhodococcus hoagii TaxID=43767 RepID=UPI0009BE6568|nr:TetR family transcriptional regulator [Prescottella equi]NKS49005.1 TetR family transcriptional regulator [Prescottella equi]OQQ24737.1 TetR family transcriptional regulator [Prescottella equi]
MPGLQPVTSLTERRKAATQLEISRRAGELFSTRGASAVTAEEIAAAAGIGLRTFYRYFRTKEEAVAPLLAGGVTGWIAYLTEDPTAGPSVRDAIENATRRALTPADDVAEEMLHWTRGLLRTVHDEPGLHAVWLRVQHDSEEGLVGALAALMGPDADPMIVRLTAAAVNAAMRIAVETWAATDAPTTGPGGPADLAERCMRTLLDHPALTAENN